MPDGVDKAMRTIGFRNFPPSDETTPLNAPNLFDNAFYFILFFFFILRFVVQNLTVRWLWPYFHLSGLDARNILSALVSCLGSWPQNDISALVPRG
ncbi:hypothetical protein I7I48_10540 [Histoplasma ohiense]|nr:hypothetical protein I7I48_10540 [Histoplasma ohiense (nom. inval.)]